MQMKLRLFLFFVIFILIITTAGCGAPASRRKHAPLKPVVRTAMTWPLTGSPQSGTITGTITDGRSGPALASVSVTVSKNGAAIATTTTNSSGVYSVNVTAIDGLDITATKTGYGSTRFQNLTFYPGGTVTVDLVMKKVFNSSWPVTAPAVTVSGVDFGATVNGVLNVTATLTGNNDPRSASMGIGQELPGNNITIHPFQAELDTGNYPEGVNQIRLIAYDYNNNSVETCIPVKIANGGGSATTFTMKKPLLVIAYTEGDDMQYDWMNNAGRTFTGLSAQANSASYVYLQWQPEFNGKPGFRGYNVYRSTAANGPWQYLGGGSFDSGRQVYCAYDYTAAVTPNVISYYQVVPVNSSGTEGSGQTGSVTPLGPFTVNLSSPANNYNGAILTPTFSWTKNTLTADRYEYLFQISCLSAGKETTGGYCLNTTQSNVVSVVFDPATWGIELQYRQMYQWDIVYACAEKQYNSNSIARSLGRRYTAQGSTNGAFVFTTKAP
jgi:hypothetical protein